IEFIGRTDHQVKIRGFRIEPGEIEAELARRDGGSQPVVIVREPTPGERRLVAYVGSERARPAELRESLRARLPDYMIPSSIVVLPRLQLNANGKIDRAALPAVEALEDPDA